MARCCGRPPCPTPFPPKLHESGVKLFIYWRVDSQRAQEAVWATHRWQAELQTRHPGVAACLYRRADAAAGRVTVMETYALAPAGLDAQCASDIENTSEQALSAWAQDGRHVERFVPLPR